MLMRDGLLAATGTGGTFVLTDLNPWLGLTCGVLTLIHCVIVLGKHYKDWREGK